MLLMLCLCTHVNAQETTQRGTLTITDLRVLNDTTAQLAAIYNIPISFEDAPIPISDEGTFFKKEKPLTLTYEIPPSGATLSTRKALATSALSDAVTDYNTAHGWHDWFTVVPTADGLDVVQRQAKKDDGSIGDFSPPFDARITVDLENNTLEEALTAIAKEVSDVTGKRIVFGGGPEPLISQCTTTLKASNEPARDIVAEAIKNCPVGYFASSNGQLVPSHMSWFFLSLSSDNKVADGMINVRIDAPPGRPTLGLGRYTQHLIQGK